MPCARAGLVDGELRCDDELPVDLLELCPGLAEGRPAAIVTGDAIDTAQRCARGRMPPAELAALAVPVELNRASEAELTSLPRIGPVLARRIVEGRPYADVEALLEVRGVGPVTLQGLRPRVFVVDPLAP